MVQPLHAVVAIGPGAEPHAGEHQREAGQGGQHGAGQADEDEQGGEAPGERLHVHGEA
jgi:hypothetical protein